MGKPKAAYLLIGALAIFTQVLRGLQAGIAVVLQKLQKIVALYEVELAGLSGFSSGFARRALKRLRAFRVLRQAAKS
jgi:hypothetical protein